MSSLHIVSWNVAGFRTTYERMCAKLGGLEEMMKKLQIDILCLQEVKLGEDQITFDPIEQNSPGLDCFFSWSGKKTGFNGVATIARRGLTVSATRALGPNGSLHDSAGRFLLTDHGEFVLINLYVHNDGDGGVNVPVKMDFLLRVRAQVESLRAAGRRMIVAGDLNLKLRALDVPWSGRSADIEALRCSQFVAGEAELVTRLRDQLAEEENWKTFRESVAQIVEVESRSRFTYRLDNKQLKIPSSAHSFGNLFEMQAVLAPVLDGTLLRSEDWARLTLGGQWICRRANSLPFEMLVHSVAVVFDWDSLPSEREMRAAADSPQAQQWLSAGRVCSNGVATSMALQDSFSVLHPNALDRFTCWDQSRNNRFSNSGARIDFILTDPLLSLSRGCVSLAGCSLCKGALKTCSETCGNTAQEALTAATACGLWQPASLQGGGLEEGSDLAYGSMIRPPHTGIIYTPPDWSDHAAVSVLVVAERGSFELQFNAATKACQPHKMQKSIRDLFRPSVAGGAAVAVSAPVEAAPESKKMKRAVSQAEKFSAFFAKKQDDLKMG